MAIPTHIFGFPARPLRPIEEVAIASARLGTVEVSVLRWERRDFEVEKLKPSDAWFASYRVCDPAGDQDLLQFKSPFFTPARMIELSSAGPRAKQGDGVSSPKWHKSDRPWPVVGKEKAEFVGQFYFGDTVAYVWISHHDGKRSFIVFQDDVSRQDIEEHYKDEARQA